MPYARSIPGEGQASSVTDRERIHLPEVDGRIEPLVVRARLRHGRGVAEQRAELSVAVDDYDTLAAPVPALDLLERRPVLRPGLPATRTDPSSDASLLTADLPDDPHG